MQRPVQVIIPFKLNGAKSRLAPVLSPDERRALALDMLEDVLKAVSDVGSVTILAKPIFDGSCLNNNFDVLECDLSLNDALNALVEDRQRKGWSKDLLIVMADLALLTSEDVLNIIQTEGDVVLSPGRGGGTNMILIRNPEFRTQYIGLSFLKHLDFAHKNGMNARIYASYRSGCDIDEPSDLAEILIHSKGETKKLLNTWGFALSEMGRAGCIRIVTK